MRNVEEKGRAKHFKLVIQIANVQNSKSMTWILADEDDSFGLFVGRLSLQGLHLSFITV